MNPGLDAGIIGAVCWFVAYILIIRRGRLDKSCGMPFAALCANISWEIIFSFIYPEFACAGRSPNLPTNYNPFARGITAGSGAQELVNIIWFLMDVLIVGTYLWYGKRDFTPLLPQKLFSPSFLVTFGMSMVIVGTSVQQFNDCEGVYSAFGMNLMMSVLFPIMLLQRGDSRGQSFYIAAMKMLGTAGFSIRFYALNPDSAFLNAQYIFILLFDMLYTGMIFQKLVKERINPLTRF